MEAQLRQLIPFLRDRNPQVRQTALSNLLPQTPKDSPHRNIFFAGLAGGGLKKPKENDIIRDLKLLCRDQLSVSHDAFRALVNLSDSPMLVSTLSEPAFLAFIVSYITNPQSVLADLAAMLLSNLTASSAACATVLSLNIDIIPEPTFPNSFYPPQSRCATCVAPVPYPAAAARASPALPLLVDAFVQGAQTDESGDASTRLRKGNVHFLASVFANLSTSPAGRTFFFGPRVPSVLETNGALEYPLVKLLAFTEHKDVIRRGGVASTLKNCVFHVPGHKAFLSPDSVGVSVPPSPSPDAAIRLMHVETLLLLCHTRWGRDHLREHGVYEIVRAAHENESVDKISEHIERLVNLLKSDEPEVDPSLDSDPPAMDAVPMPETSAGSSESDDEDNRIDEV
ncbi:hypothetical protein B0H17DRAFT_1031405 [Mycena rosella]|uniref:Protein HGH1 homolog n=1 Tax=Mycena rosella TaxID=1033263 RepID=A0AAD7GZV7_MYCRO|nr:hypothetical protein B0H17DRAFT_1031405 [Mycena rosella]